jgi:hypothetical protein
LPSLFLIPIARLGARRGAPATSTMCCEGVRWVPDLRGIKP